MKSKKQILYIHGGETFRNQNDYLKYLKNKKVVLKKDPRWHHDYLDKELSSTFDIFRPRMPLQENAKYKDWKIMFEKFIPFLKNDVILMGGSLGGIFLAKYLSENKFPKKIKSVYLVCAPFDDTCPTEDLVGGFKLKSDISMIEENCKDTTFLFSKDDEVVPVSHAEKYRNKLPNVKIVVYKSKNGHFQISKFPEIVKMIKDSFKK